MENENQVLPTEDKTNEDAVEQEKIETTEDNTVTEEQPTPPEDNTVKEEQPPPEKEEEAPPVEDTPVTEDTTVDPPTDEAPKDTTEESPPVIDVTTDAEVTKEEPSKEIENIEEPAEEQGGLEQEAAPPAPTRPPRTKYFSLQPDDPVDILMGENGLEADEPITVGQMFKESVQQYSDITAMAYKEGETWTHITYTLYYEKCVAAAKSFLKLELEPYHSVAIIGFNSPEWFISAMGAILAGGLVLGIYATNNPEACKFIAEDGRADIIVVENQKQLEKILLIRDQLPNLKAIVQYKGKLTEQHPDVYEWDQFMELGNTIDTQVVEDKIAQQKPGCCASLIYTSGTVGNPKGVMLSHDAITWTVKSFLATYTVIQRRGMERVVSYLPLSHIAAQFLDMFVMMACGGTTYFAQPDAMKGTLLTSLQEVRPTLFPGVPRVWEKFMDRIKELAPSSGFKAKIGSWAKDIGLRGNMNMQTGVPVPWGWTIANMLVFKKAREAFGLNEAKIIATTAAPIRREVLEFFMSLNLTLLELYGMSEGCGPVATNKIEPNKWKLGTVGRPFVGVGMKIHNPDEQGEGELCYRGRNVMMGYYNNAEKTAETLDEEGWLHSGDLAIVDEDGFYTITGRIKELIITSGGENIAPVPIENNIKQEVPFLSNVMVVGDHRNYLTCLLTLKCQVDLDTNEPTDDLTAQAASLIAAKGSSATKISQIIDNQDQAVFTAIQEGIDRANAKAISNAATVKKWSLLDADFSEPSGELGPTQKLKRFFVAQKYSATIEGLYTE